MSERHSISVIIPAYNRAGLIGETLRSLLNQTMPAKEIIVVDDGSTDGTVEAVEREFSVFSKQFSENSKSNIPTLKMIRQKNAGPGAARNRGLAEATGEFIHFFDSDDIASPNKHEVQLEALLRTGADIAYGPWVKGRFASKEAQMVAGDEFHAEARRRGGEEDLITTDQREIDCRRQLRRSESRDSKDTESTEEDKAGARLGKPSGSAFSNPLPSEFARDCANTSPIRSADGPASSPETSHSSLVTVMKGSSSFQFPVSSFSAEGPVLQARGLPKGDLVKALLTNWSVVPHACLFRRSILEKAGGFPEDIWVGEDQLLFLRCLLAGAKVVHTPETLVLYRLGEEGKLTASKEGHVRRVTHWAKFLVKANQEVGVHAEARRRGNFKLTTESTEVTAGQGLDKPSCAAFSNPFTSELTRDFESAGGNQFIDSKRVWEGQSQAGLQMDSPNLDSICSTNEARACREQSDKNPVNFVNPVKSLKSVKNGFGFRLRAYLAWRDLVNLEKRDPSLEKEIELIWKRSRFSGFRFQVSGFVLRKLGGLKQRVFGHRWSATFRCGKMGFKS